MPVYAIRIRCLLESRSFSNPHQLLSRRNGQEMVAKSEQKISLLFVDFEQLLDYCFLSNQGRGYHFSIDQKAKNSARFKISLSEKSFFAIRVLRASTQNLIGTPNWKSVSRTNFVNCFCFAGLIYKLCFALPSSICYTLQAWIFLENYGNIKVA